MIKNLLPAFCFGIALTLSSCIADEAPNSECDIVSVDSIWLAENTSIVSHNVKNNSVNFMLEEGSDRSAFAPKFNITPGAEIFFIQADGTEVPANGITADFTQPQEYVVHAEDGVWKKVYKVSFNYKPYLNELHFEHVEMIKSKAGADLYEKWIEINGYNDTLDYWATGNPGYNLSKEAKTPADFPTASTGDAVIGKGLKLTTRSTGNFGLQTRPRMPIAAGNIFIGNFNTSKAVSKPREATTFGEPLVTMKPLRLEGYYKYTAGETVTNQSNQAVDTLADTCDIYSVVYEINPEKFVPLNGDDVLTSERIVLMARIDNPGEPQEWTFFSEDFKEKNGKTFSQEKADNGEYAIAIVATSSRQGAYFIGAVGSTLFVDELRVVWDE